MDFKIIRTWISLIILIYIYPSHGECDDNSVSFYGRCVRVFYQKVTSSDAHAQCKAVNGSLLELDQISTELKALSTALNLSEPLWLGGGRKRTWEWNVDGSTIETIERFYWGSGEPNQLTGLENRIVVNSLSSFDWMAVSEDDSFLSLCQRSVGQSGSADIQIVHSGVTTEYFIIKSESPKAWLDAVIECEGYGGSLIKVETVGVQYALENINITKHDMSGNYWTSGIWSTSYDITWLSGPLIPLNNNSETIADKKVLQKARVVSADNSWVYADPAPGNNYKLNLAFGDPPTEVFGFICNVPQTSGKVIRRPLIEVTSASSPTTTTLLSSTEAITPKLTPSSAETSTAPTQMRTRNTDHHTTTQTSNVTGTPKPDTTTSTERTKSSAETSTPSTQIRTRNTGQHTTTQASTETSTPKPDTTTSTERTKSSAETSTPTTQIRTRNTGHHTTTQTSTETSTPKPDTTTSTERTKSSAETSTPTTQIRTRNTGHHTTAQTSTETNTPKPDTNTTTSTQSTKSYEETLPPTDTSAPTTQHVTRNTCSSKSAIYNSTNQLSTNALAGIIAVGVGVGLLCCLLACCFLLKPLCITSKVEDERR